MRLYNNNPAFGHEGPFDSDEQTFEAACEGFANEMMPQIREWAREEMGGWEADPVRAAMEVETSACVGRLRSEFIAGLSVVCPRCGKHGPIGEGFICGATFGCPGY
jgi:hypothetical protein